MYSINQPRLSVAVITSTVGRKSLERAIRSVEAQTYPTTHYIFVDGPNFHQQAQEILQKFPNIKVLYLPNNTGANGKTNGCINASSAFLVEEDILCYLDDDNWYAPHHIESGVKALLNSQADYAYALRNFCDHHGNFVCVDCVESIGDLPHNLPESYPLIINAQNERSHIQLTVGEHKFVDTNCYFIKKETAQLLGQAWISGLHNDRNVFKTLKFLEKRGVCTRTLSVNYTLDIKKFMGFIFQMELLSSLNEEEKYIVGYDIVREIARNALTYWGDEEMWRYTA